MIQWYPGHMAKAIREMNDKVKIVDFVIVLLDARCPESSFNPLLKEILKNKKCLYILNKKDKADTKETIKWLEYYCNNNIKVIALDARDIKNDKIVIREAESLMEEKRKKDLAKGIKVRTLKTMVVGIPNVGKSTLINSLVKKRVTAVGDKPGITKNQQWIKINHNLELLDTPGVLWPKFDEPIIGLHLSIIGSINDTILPIVDIASYFVDFLQKYYPNALKERYHIHFDNNQTNDIISKIAHKQNYLLSNKEEDFERTALFILQEYRMGYYGRITLDRCVKNE